MGRSRWTYAPAPPVQNGAGPAVITPRGEESCKREIQVKAAPLTNEYLGTAYLALGRCAEAVPVLRRAAQPAVRQSIPLAMLGYALAKSGQRAEAERILEELLERQRRGYIAPTSLAVLQAGSAIPSRRSHGFAGRSKRDPFLVYNYVNEPLMAPFRRDPRGQDILRAMGLDGRGR